MRPITKTGIGIMVVAVGVSAGYYAWRGQANKPTQTTAESNELAPPIADATTPEPSNADTARADHATPTATTAAPASPPPVVVPDRAERSFRPPVMLPPVEPARTAATPTPAAPKDPAPTVVTPPPQPAPVAVQPSTVHTDPAIIMKPADAPAATSAKPAETATKEYVVQAGDTYSSIAAKHLGSTRHAPLIAKANPGRDPRRLFVGAKLRIPAAPPETTTATQSENTKLAAATSPTGKSTAPSLKDIRGAKEPAAPIPADHAYKVKTGEGWYDLAQRFLGDGNRWTELYELNKERVPRNPHGLRSGMTIEVPTKVTTKPS